MTGDGESGRVLSSSLLLRPSATVNAFEETVRRLVQSLRLGLVAPGDRLPPERELASMLGVSRDTLREAIGALVASGYLVSKRGRYGGTFAMDPLPPMSEAAPGDENEDDAATAGEALADTLALRAVVEVGIVRRLASIELTADDRDRLWRAHEACVPDALDHYRVSDTHLHLLLGQLVGAPSLVPMLADIRMKVNSYLDRIPLLVPNLQHACDQHQQIIESVLRGNPDDAARAMEAHLTGTEELLRGFLG